MFQNMLFNSLVTPLHDNDETSGWVNRPFNTVCPQQLQKSYKGEVTRTIKKKSKRIRTAFTTDQLRGLEKAFTRTRYIDPQTRKEIASQLNIGEKSVKIWFQNRRMKEKKDSESSCDSSTESFTESSPKSVLNSEIKPEIPDEIVFQNEHTIPTQQNYIPAAKSTNISTNYELYDDTAPHFYNTNPSMYQPSNYNYPQYYQYYATNSVEPNNTDFSYHSNVYPSEYYPVSQHYTTHQTTQTQWEYNCPEMADFYFIN